MNYVAVISGDTEKGVFTNMMVYNKGVCGRNNQGRNISFSLDELKAQTHAFVVHGMNDLDDEEHSIEEIFLSYDQAMKFAWICSMVNRTEELKNEFSYANNPKRFLNQYKELTEKLLNSMQKIGLPVAPLIDISNNGVSLSFIDAEKITYMNGNEEKKLPYYFCKANNKFMISPVAIVMPLHNGEIHQFAKADINYASFF